MSKLTAAKTDLKAMHEAGKYEARVIRAGIDRIDELERLLVDIATAATGNYWQPGFGQLKRTIGRIDKMLGDA